MVNFIVLFFSVIVFYSGLATDFSFDFTTTNNLHYALGPLTAIFAHINASHLWSNGFFLLLLGLGFESKVGSRRVWYSFIVAVLAMLVGGLICQHVLGGVGAMGASGFAATQFGAMGVWCGLGKKTWIPRAAGTTFLGLCLYVEVTRALDGNSGTAVLHLTGLAMGVLLASLCPMDHSSSEKAA